MDAGIAEVVKFSVNVPPVPVVVVLCPIPSIVTVTVSPAGGCTEPEVNVPLSGIDAAPAVIDCDAVSALKVAVALFTVNVVLMFVAELKFESPA